MSELTLPAPVTDWGMANVPGEDLFYRAGFWPQITMIRDQIARLVSETYDEWKGKVSVVSTHRSKSIKLPVFAFEAQGTRFTLRYNFYNWNVSVESDRPVGEWAKAFDDAHDYCFCEGMSEKLFGPHSEDPTRFTICIHDDYELYTFFWLWRRERGLSRKD